MIKGDGVKMTREYFELLESIWKSRGLKERPLSLALGRSHSHVNRIKRRRQLMKSWEIAEKSLGISPRTLFAMLTRDIEYDQVLTAFGPQDAPQKPEVIAEFEKLVEVIESSPGCREGEIHDETWAALETLERRRFKDPRAVEKQCQGMVIDSAQRSNELLRDEAVVAVGALGVWSTIRRHGNDPGSAVQALVLAIRSSIALAVDKILARQLQRAAYLLGDVDQYRPAKMMAERAVSLYSDLQDLQGLATALIDTGFMAFGTRDLEKAEARVLLGADLLGSSPLSHIYKASAYQLAAKSCSIRGDLRTSCQHLERAARYAVSYEKEWAAIRWCAGNIQFQLGLFDEAESALREALHLYLRADRVTDIVMLLLDLATVLIAERRIDDIPALAQHLQPYLERLSEKDQVRNHVEEAHACLVRARHVQALERFKEEYKKAWRRGFATP